jgi:hypothetical protein
VIHDVRSCKNAYNYYCNYILECQFHHGGCVKFSSLFRFLTMTNETLNLGIDVKVGGPTKMNHNIIMHFLCYSARKLTVTTTVPMRNLELS